MSNIAPKRPAVTREISRHDLDVMMTTAAAQSRRLARSLRLSPAEQEDAEQDILVMLVERWHYFDDSRGSNVAFAIRIGRQAAQVIADRIVSEWERDIRWQAADDVGLPGHLLRRGRHELAGGRHREPARRAECVGAVVQVVRAHRAMRQSAGDGAPPQANGARLVAGATVRR